MVSGSLVVVVVVLAVMAEADGVEVTAEES